MPTTAWLAFAISIVALLIGSLLINANMFKLCPSFVNDSTPWEKISFLVITFLMGFTEQFSSKVFDQTTITKSGMC